MLLCSKPHQAESKGSAGAGAGAMVCDHCLNSVAVVDLISFWVSQVLSIFKEGGVVLQGPASLPSFEAFKGLCDWVWPTWLVCGNLPRLRSVDRHHYKVSL